MEQVEQMEQAPVSGAVFTTGADITMLACAVCITALSTLCRSPVWPIMCWSNWNKTP